MKKKIEIIAIVLLLSPLLLMKTMLMYGQQQPVDQEKMQKHVRDSTIARDMFLQERSFFLGQKYALKNDVRIVWDFTNNRYKWIKSPWNDGKLPLYQPTVEDSK